MSSPEISVVVPSHDRTKGLMRLVDALEGQTLEPERFEVLVAHDSPAPETDAALQRHPLAAAGRLRALRVASGSGPALKRNTAVEAALAPIVAFTDDDCVPEATWLEAGLRVATGAELVQGAVVPDPTAAAGPFDRSVRVGGESGLYETANLFVRRELFRAVGGFESPFVPDSGRPFGEDVWLGWRMRRAGARSAYAPAARVLHEVVAQGPLPYIRERWRTTHFPELARLVPELRSRPFFKRLFLTRRSAAFDLALGAAGLAARQHSLLPLVATLPYVQELGRARVRTPGQVLTAIAADSVGLVALARGSVRSRTVVL